ncbi:MAG: SDR family oxidoreductase [Planctomycetes bacterium]|nr:SDR family oxidoreductase [Planctomycetota bacterium]
MSASKKTIVVTGATRGLGRAMVARFIEQGHTVLGCGRDSVKVASLTAHYGKPHDFSVVDVSRDAEVAKWAKRLLDKFGPPDLLVNNAALVNKNAPLWKVTAAEFQQVLDVNIGGVANCIRHFVPAMAVRRKGVIINFSSGWGRSASPEVAPYCATKWAIEGLTQALAQELPRGMAAVPLNPGIINTDMLQSCFGGSASHYPDAEKWSQSAVPFILKIGPKDNGKPLSLYGE